MARRASSSIRASNAALALKAFFSRRSFECPNTQTRQAMLQARQTATASQKPLNPLMIAESISQPPMTMTPLSAAVTGF